MTSEECLAGARVDVFRLESLPIYRIGSDWLRFERFRDGELEICDNSGEPYLRLLDRLAEREVRVRRVRVVDFPLHDYLRYELACYRVSAQRGEIVLLLERPLYVHCYQSQRVANDFWLVDDVRAIEMLYGDDGSFLTERAVEASKIAAFVEMKTCLLGRAMPMEEFLAEAGLGDEAQTPYTSNQ